MTPQEQQMLQDLTNRINGTVLPDKDPTAEQYLQQTLGRNPDALYILAQTVLVQQYALDQAKKQLSDQKDQIAQTPQQAQQQPVKHTSFLASLLGGDEPSRPAPPPQGQYGQTQYAPVANYGPPQPPPQYGQPQYAQPAYGQSQGGGFLRSAMQTATGVAAGALAFEGIESLMHGFGQHSGYGGGSGFGNFSSDGGSGRSGEVVNNYYGDSAGHEHEGGLSRDIEDRRDDGNDSGNRNQFAESESSSDNSDDSDNRSNFSDNSGDGSSDDSSSSDDGF